MKTTGCPTRCFAVFSLLLSPVDALGRCDDPRLAEDGTGAEQDLALQEGHLVIELSVLGILPAGDAQRSSRLQRFRPG